MPDITPLPPTEGLLSLDSPAAGGVTLLLRALKPSTLTLKGPADLRFRRFALTATAQPLQRNLALPFWGSATYPVAGGTDAQPEQTLHVVLPGTSRVEAMGLTANPPLDGATVELTGSEQQSVTYTLPRQGQIACAVDTSVLRFRYPGRGAATAFIRSPSLPGGVMVELPGGVLLDAFGEQLQANEPRPGRNVADAMNQAWQGTELTLRIIAATDGIVTIAADGEWFAYAESPLGDLRLEPGVPAALPVPWPAAWPHADLRVELAGSLAATRRLGLTGASGDVGLRVTEARQVAQRLPLPQQPVTVAGIWLQVPQFSRAPAQVDLWLKRGSPAGATLGGLSVTLPEAFGEGGWFRAPLPEPLVLQPDQTEPLYLVAGGHDAGTLLSGRITAELVEHPAWPVPTDNALVCSSDRGSGWEQVVVGAHAVAWLFDLDILPDPAAGPLLSLQLAGGEALTLPAIAPGNISLETAPLRVARPAGPQLVLQAGAGVPARLRGTVKLMRPIRQ